MVFHFVQEEWQRIHVFIFCIEEVEVEMRPEGVTRIATASYLLTSLYGVFLW